MLGVCIEISVKVLYLTLRYAATKKVKPCPNIWIHVGTNDIFHIARTTHENKRFTISTKNLRYHVAAKNKTVIEIA